MIASPVKNFNTFFKTRPPLVTFLVCLIALAIATFSFAFYIERESKIINSDFKHDWLKMLKHFNKLDYCVQNSKQYSYLENKQSKEFVTESVVHTVVNIEHLDNLKQFSNVKGTLTLNKWESDCPKNNEKPSNLQIIFNIPRTNTSSKDICVSIKGPEEYLPKFSSPICSTNDINQFDAVLLSKHELDSEANFCVGGIQPKLTFHLDKTENFAIYLSKDDKTSIYVHLMWVSYVLVIVIMGILLYGIFHKQKFEDKSNNYRIS